MWKPLFVFPLSRNFNGIENPWNLYFHEKTSVSNDSLQTPDRLSLLFICSISIPGITEFFGVFSRLIFAAEADVGVDDSYLFKYRLSGVVVHNGSAAHGEYYSLIRLRDGNADLHSDKAYLHRHTATHTARENTHSKHDTQAAQWGIIGNL